jgi:hypothetical protein
LRLENQADELADEKRKRKEREKERNQIAGKRRKKRNTRKNKERNKGRVTDLNFILGLIKDCGAPDSPFGWFFFLPACKQLAFYRLSCVDLDFPTLKILCKPFLFFLVCSFF